MYYFLVLSSLKDVAPSDLKKSPRADLSCLQVGENRLSRGLLSSFRVSSIVNSGKPCFPALENAEYNETGEKFEFWLKVSALSR